MGDVVRRDFGKEDREAARTFARLMKIVADTEDDILANPGKYLAMASAKLAEAERFRMRLYGALHTPWMVNVSFTSSEAPTFNEILVIQIDKRDYEALQAVRKIINES